MSRGVFDLNFFCPYSDALYCDDALPRNVLWQRALGVRVCGLECENQ